MRGSQNRSRALVDPFFPALGEGVEIDWSSPLAAGLVLDFEFGFTGDMPLDLVSGQLFSRAATTGDGPDWNDGLHGRCFDFDAGNRDFIDIPSALPHVDGSAYTLEIMLAIDAHDSSGSVIFGTNTTSNVFFQLGTSNTVVVGGTTAGTGSTPTWADGEFHLYHFVSNPAAPAVHLFRDGVWTRTAASAGAALASGAKNFALGKWLGGTAWDVDGRIAFARFFARAMDDAEVAERNAHPYAHLRRNGNAIVIPVSSAGFSISADKFTLTISTDDTTVVYNVNIPANKFTAAITPKTATWAISAAAAKFLIAITTKVATPDYQFPVAADKFELAVTMKTATWAISSAVSKFLLSINMKTLNYTGEIASVFTRLAGFVGQTVGRLLGR